MKKNALYGIHSKRAQENFPDKTPFHIERYKAIGLTKLACYNIYKNFKMAVLQKTKKSPVELFDDKIINALQKSAKEISEGKYFDHFIVPAIQGGAGTSINMNVNEIIANISLKSIHKNPGEYNIIDPIEHANIYQSTNDVIPTSLKVAVIQLLTELEESINRLRFKVVNLGGSAIGIGITVPRYFIMEVVNELQRLTKLPITKSENLPDATSNLDTFVEIHAILKSHAVNLEKMVNDIRLLASDLGGEKILSIPQKQAGSSIMPGKINPVIPEFVISATHKIYANDSLISNLSAQGCLELNAYLPIIGHSIIDSIKLLIASNNTLKKNLFEGLQINQSKSEEKLYKSPAITTALVPYIGYHKASELAKEMKYSDINIFEANKTLGVIEEVKLDKILEIQNLLKPGFSINDL